MYGDPVRSPTRAPSVFDLAASQLLQESSEWVIEGSEIELGRRIGAGSYGEVFRGQWRHTDVAVKRITNVNESLVEVGPPSRSLPGPALPIHGHTECEADKR